MAVKKQWYEIVAPKMFNEKVIGETLSADPKMLAGRIITVNLTELSNDYSRFFVKLRFRITDVNGIQLHTAFIGHDCMYERIYRMAQRHTRRVDCIQDVETKDGVKLRVKTIFILRRRVNTALKSAARHKARELIELHAQETKLEDFINMILSGDLQKKVRKECSKIYPVGNFEIRKTDIKTQ